MWEDLRALRGRWEDPWCLGSDFNVLRSPDERHREGRWLGAMRRFSHVIDDLVLKDLPLKGGRFTWAGGSGNQRMARLDRFLVSNNWEEYFGFVSQGILPKPFSNHSPILLEGGFSPIRGPSPFLFENMWLKSEDFHNLIDGWWKSFIFKGTNSFVLMEMLKALKCKLKSWNKDVFGRVEVRKIQPLQNLAHWNALGN